MDSKRSSGPESSLGSTVQFISLDAASEHCARPNVYDERVHCNENSVTPLRDESEHTPVQSRIAYATRCVIMDVATLPPSRRSGYPNALPLSTMEQLENQPSMGHTPIPKTGLIPVHVKRLLKHSTT